MTTLLIGAYAGSTLTGTSISATGLTVQLNWDQQLPNEKVEVWKGTTSDQTASAYLSASYDHNYQDALNAGSGVFYYFIRTITDRSGYGPFVTLGPVTVSGGTATVADGSITPAKLNNSFAIDPSSGNLKSGVVGVANLGTTSISTATLSSSNGGSTGSLSDYNTWHSFGTYSFTAASHTFYQIYMSIIVQFGTPTMSSGSTATVSARFRLYDSTAGADVPAGTQNKTLYYVMNIAGNNVIYVNNPIAETNMVIAEGFREQLISGHSYVLYGEISRTGSATINVPVTVITSSSTGSGAVLA